MVSVREFCVTCDHEARLDELPAREQIATDEHWRVAHATGVALLGWLVLVPRRHVTAIADLDPAEALGLGQWQVRLSQALGAALGCAKTYVAQFAEAEGFRHVHFHVVPRMPDLAQELRGPRVFTLLGRQDRTSVDESDMDALARRLQPLLRR